MSEGSNIWGPKAWNLLHSFSINNNVKIFLLRMETDLIALKSGQCPQ